MLRHQRLPRLAPPLLTLPATSLGWSDTLFMGL